MQPPGKLSGTREISLQENIPGSFLGKVLLQLRRKHLLRSYKGIGGGYELALAPDRINLLMVVRSVDGDDLFESCLLEDRQCVPSRPCAMHDAWTQIRDQLRRTLETNTVAELVRARMLGSGSGGTEGLPPNVADKETSRALGYLRT